MKILITGAMGRLGSALTRLLEAHHTVIATDTTPTAPHALDITDFVAVQRAIEQHQPDLMMHPAGWTDVDGCARDPQRAVLINGLGTHHIALASAQHAIPMLYVSTNEVFDGAQDRPYWEYDPTRPINPYGYSKWVGEQAVMRHNPQHYIVRTAWLFAHGGKNFLQTIIQAVRDGKPLRVVTDEVANPTYTDDLAHAIVQLITTQRYGTYHLVNEGATSRYDFARYILDCAGMQATPITPITSADWQRASTPPAYAPMANLAGTCVDITLRPWQEAVRAFLAQEGLLA